MSPLLMHDTQNSPEPHDPSETDAHLAAARFAPGRAEGAAAGAILIDAGRVCEVCARPLAPIGTDVCRRCGKRLCAQHLYGRWPRLKRFLRFDRLCPDCRRRGGP
jgi:hypothetical protein